MKILITGSSRGIGLAEAKIFDKPENELFLVATSLNSFNTPSFSNAKVHLFATNLTSEEEIKNLIKEISSITDGIDVLINNVGVMIMKKFESMTFQDIHKLIDLDLTSHILLTKFSLPLLHESRRPHIVFMSSMAAKSFIIGESVYSATKGAITNFANVLRNELAPKFKVTAVHAWGVNTFGFDKPELLLKPEDVAETVEFIVTRNKNFLIESVDLSNITQWRGSNAPWSPQ